MCPVVIHEDSLPEVARAVKQGKVQTDTLPSGFSSYRKHPIGSLVRAGVRLWSPKMPVVKQLGHS